jgi:DNA helicase-2/ATP-dependent DNA helicase PcrA
MFEPGPKTAVTPAEAVAGSAERAPPAADGWLASLNPAQREAVTADDGPLLVVAGAGTGKTWTLACRVAHLIERGVPPERILLLTFSRRAAREMLARAGRLTDRSASGRVWGGTFHAMANRLLRIYGRPVGIQPDFTVLDQGDAADLMNLVRTELGLDRSKRRFPRKDTLASIYSRTVNAGEKLALVLERAFPWCGDEAQGMREVFAIYTRRKREQNVMDYDDLLLYWNQLVRAQGVGGHVAGLFDHVLVDEYQDTNRLQAEILIGIRQAPAPNNLMVVGDDAQAIYSFRAATNRNILEFEQDFPGARVVKLERNYRSIPPILAASNAAIALSPKRHEKTLSAARRGDRRPVLLTCLDENEQSDAVCKHLLEHREQGVPLKRQAILFRAAHHSDLLEVELARRNIPFVKYGGLKFLEAAHVKDMLCLLRLLENPFDEVSWFRVLQLPDGIGPAGARRLIAELGVRRPSPDGVELAVAEEDPDSVDGGKEAAGSNGKTPLHRFLDRPPAVPDAARQDLAALVESLGDCVEPDIPAATQVERLRRFLDPIVARRYPSAASRIRDLDQLEHLASGTSSRGRFIDDLALDPPASTGDLAGPPLLDEDYVILSTIHSAKGGEWDVVHLIHAADGMMPSDLATGDAEEIEEERRLFYVALTRARDALYVTFPLRYYHRPKGLDDRHNYAQLTRFLTADVRGLFDERCTFADDPRSGPTANGLHASNGAAAAAVDEFLADLWG